MEPNTSGPNDLEPGVDPCELPILRSDSYTATQLCFLTPEIMHTESRVLLLGSIPDTIGRRSRKSGRRALLALIDARRKAWRTLAGGPPPQHFTERNAHEPREHSGPSIHNGWPQLFMTKRALEAAVKKQRDQSEQPVGAIVDPLETPDSLSYNQEAQSSSFVTAADPNDERPHRFTPEYETSGTSEASVSTSATMASSETSTPNKPNHPLTHETGASTAVAEDDFDIGEQRLKLTRNYTNDVPKLESTVANGQPILGAAQAEWHHTVGVPTGPSQWNHNPSIVISKDDSQAAGQSDTKTSTFLTTPEVQKMPAGGTLPTKIQTRSTLAPPPRVHTRIPTAQTIQVLDPGPADSRSQAPEPGLTRPASLWSTNSSHLTTSSSRTSTETHASAEDEILFRSHMLVQTRQFKKRVEHNLRLATDMRQAVTRIDTRWKEQVVAVRLSRTTADTVVIHMANTSERAIRKPSNRHGVKVKVNSDWSLCFYSALDLTLGLWSPVHKHLYIFQCQGMTRRLELVKLLSQYTRPPPPPKPLLMRFPEEELFLRVPAKWEGFQQWALPPLVTAAQLMNPASSVSPSQGALLRLAWSARRQARQEPAPDSSVKKYALAWRYSHKLDEATPRILWINPASSELLHTFRNLVEADYHLEVMRPKTETRGDEGMIEPPAIEGFCHRYSAWGGGIRNVKRSMTYLHTHNHLLLITSASLAEPPPVGDSLFYTPDAYGQPFIQSQLAETDKDPEHEIAPYALDDKGRFDWLNRCTCVEDTQWFDSVAIVERDRRSRIIANADLAFDLGTVTDVEIENDKDFRIVLSNTETIGIHVPSIEVRDAWVHRLRDLVKYWRLRRNADSIRRCTGQIDFQVTPLIKNRSILHQGFLYHKDHKFTTLRSRYCVLTKDSLALYSVHSLVPTIRGHQATGLARAIPGTESSRGIPAVTVNNSRAGYKYRLDFIIDLKGCYVYSGLLAEDMLISAVDSYADPSKPGLWALPRSYEDGWISEDNEGDRCFVLWRSTPRRVLKNVRANRARVETFLARSAIDRDLWVSALRTAVQSREE